MAGKTSDWRPGPTVCRCCLTEGCYKDISTEYFWMGKREVYAEMLSDTFNVSISYAQTGGRLICEPCIARLRDASDFKRQVQDCEKTFMTHLDPSTSKASSIQIEVESVDDVKMERVKVEKDESDDDDYIPGPDFGDDDDDDDLDDEPLQKLASSKVKVPKKETVEILDMLDTSQITVKRKSSSKNKEPPKKVKKKEVVVKPTTSKAKAAAAAAEKKKKGSILELCKQIENYQKQNRKDESRKLPQHENAELFLKFSNSCPFKTRFKQILCPFCYDEYNTLTEYKNHINIEHSNYDLKNLFHGLKDNLVYADITDLKCTICSQKIEDVDTFMKHLSEEHKKPVRFDARFGVLPIIVDTNNHYACPCCHVGFTELVPARKHIETHFSSFKCDLCGAMFVSNQSLECHNKKGNCVELKQFNPHAGKEMKCRVNAQILLQNSTAVPFRVWKNNFQCLLCRVHVREPQALRIHFAFDHPNYPVQKAFYKKLYYDFLNVDITDLHCKLCAVPLPNLEVLMSHLKMIHNEPLDMDSKYGLLPFNMNNGNLWKCCVCMVNEFNDFYSLRKHTADHFQNYVCDVCGDGFITNRALGFHNRLHHA